MSGDPVVLPSLDDRYHIERELGSGGVAVVYLARDRKLDREVAIKVLRPELGTVFGADPAGSLRNRPGSGTSGSRIAAGTMVK